MQQGSLFEQDEVIVEKVRKHAIVYLEDFFGHGLVGLIFIFLAYAASNRGYLPFLSEKDGAVIALVLISLVLLFWTSFFYAWTKTYLDIWYITNQHIVAVNQKQLFEREEAFMELSRIQDVFFEKEGFLGTLLGYGKLKVQSAGTEQEFVIEGVRDVEEVAHRIMDLRDNAHKKGTREDASV